MEGRPQEVQAAVRDEGDVQGQDHYQTQCQIRYERATDPHLTQQSLPGQYVLRIPGQREPLPGDGPAEWRRPKVPYLQTPEIH